MTDPLDPIRDDLVSGIPRLEQRRRRRFAALAAGAVAGVAALGAVLLSAGGGNRTVTVGDADTTTTVPATSAPATTLPTTTSAPAQPPTVIERDGVRVELLIDDHVSQGVPLPYRVVITNTGDEPSRFGFCEGGGAWFDPIGVDVDTLAFDEQPFNYRILMTPMCLPPDPDDDIAPGASRGISGPGPLACRQDRTPLPVGPYEAVIDVVGVRYKVPVEIVPAEHAPCTGVVPTLETPPLDPGQVAVELQFLEDFDPTDAVVTAVRVDGGTDVAGSDVATRGRDDGFAILTLDEGLWRLTADFSSHPYDDPLCTWVGQQEHLIEADTNHVALRMEAECG